MTAGHTVRPSFCRFCGATCGILVTVADGRPVKVVGDAEHPVSRGFTCEKGRALPSQHNDPHRLLTSVRRDESGRQVPISVDAALDEVADRLRRIVDADGPGAVALYAGNGATNPLAGAAAKEFLTRLGSPMYYKSATIDQPGKIVAGGMHGHWDGGPQDFDDADVWLFAGTNPVVSMWGGIAMISPTRRLREARQRGCRIIVLDPRRTELAAFADVHLRPQPGQDAVLLAGIIHVLLGQDLLDDAFVRKHVHGLDALREAVAPFSPASVEEHTGVPASDLVAAAEMIGRSRRGGATGGVGINMSGRANLNEYLLLCLMSLKGFWRREGDPVPNPGVLQPQRIRRAQAVPQPPWWEGPRTRTKGLTATPQGMPTGALADEILVEGPGRVRALFAVGGNPAVNFPDQGKVLAALERLDLLVVLDVWMSQTARLADFVFANKLSLEMPGHTGGFETLDFYGPTVAGYPVAFAQYTPRVVDPPPGSDLVEEWQVFHGLSRRLGLTFTPLGVEIPDPPPPLEELMEASTRSARVALSDVRAHPHGALFPADAVVQPRDPTWHPSACLEVGHPRMLAELTGLLKAATPPRPGNVDAAGIDVQLITRRMRNVYNSSGTQVAALRALSHGGNPAHLHPDDMRRLGAEDGARVQIASPRGAITTTVRSDRTMMPGTVALSHGWGDPSSAAGGAGSPVNRLIDSDQYDRYTGIPVMSGVAVRILTATEKG